MQCGKRRNNYLPKLIKICFVFLILTNSAFSAACQSKPKGAASILLPCQELIDKDAIQAASKCYEEAISANPKQANEIEEVFSKSFFEKCLEFKEKKNYQQSIVCLEGLSVLTPDSANVQFQMADSYYEYNKTKTDDDFDLLERAEKAAKTGLKIKSEDAAAQFLLGEILAREGDLQGALKGYQQAVKLERKVDLYWIKMALAQEKVGDLPSAITSYYQVLQFDPNNILALYYSAVLYEKTGNLKKAIENYEKLLEIKGEFDDARERLENLKKPKNSKTPKGSIVGVPNSPPQ